ncbi:hypothetical protein [Spongiimicrobium sp. 3-5]|uniref:hypothetical protein n=1 Tax=Spongiimicrobium sp. 3-5 TaxID=3332596 RepID=UPI00397EB27B
MKVLILRTDIGTKKKVEEVKPIFKKLSVVAKWSVDLEDVDNVLRIETTDGLNERDVINLLGNYGFQCEELTY